MNTNFEITIQTFKSLHEPLQLLQRTCLFTKLFKSRDNQVIKRKVFQTKKEWLTWKSSIIRELLNQRILSSKYPDKVLTILNYTVETTNHQRNLYITYDCGNEVEPLFQYLNNNSVSFQEQAQIFEQLLQISCILFKSQFEHTNLKPNNILYYKKQVLITDFGSARTHYQNFIKEYPTQAEKDWQNNLIFFYPQEYQKIMQEDNLDFRNESWQDVDISNQKFRKSIDIWALSMMMIQVFENNQTLPNKLSNYYGLNEQLLYQKIENLKQYSAGIFSEVIYSLIIEKKEPEQVYQRFIKQKQMLNIVSSQMESTFNITIKQIFDIENQIGDDTTFPSYKPENYFLDKNKIENLQGQFDDDASSVMSSNYQIELIGFTEIKPKNNLIPIPNLLPPSRNQSATTRKKPQTQKYEFSLNPDPISEFIDRGGTSQTNIDNKRRTIVVTNYDQTQQENQAHPFQEKPINDDDNPIIPKSPKKDHQQSDVLQIINLQSIQDDEIAKSPPNQSPNFNQNGTSPFQFLDAQRLDIFNDIPLKEVEEPKINGHENFKIPSIIHIGQKDKIPQPIQKIEDPNKINGQQLGNNPYSLGIIKDRLNEGVTALKEQEQIEILGQLQMIQKILNNIQQHITDPKEILDLEYEKQQQIPQLINDLIQQNEKEQLILFKDVNDGVESIIQNQQASKLIQNNQIEKNLHLLNILNQEQLEQGKVKLQGNKILIAEIEKLIEVKKDLNRFIKNPNMQNLLKKHQIELLNKEELKIYKRLLEIMPKDKRQGDKILIQQSEVEKRLKQIEQKKQEEEIQQKLIEFLKNPSFDKLLPNIYLKQLDDEKKQKYKAALEDLINKVQQRQKQSIKEQIDIINKDLKKIKPKDLKIQDKIQEVNNNKPSINQKFQDAYINIMNKLGDEVDGDLLSLNQYIREFQLTSVTYQLTDLLPDDCQKYQQQVTKRIPQFYDFQGSKYKGETLNDKPDGIGILRKMGVSSIYKGIFKQGKFFWGQVLEMNDQGQLTQYVGYYNQEHQVKHGKARLKWYQPQKIGFCGGYLFNDYEVYEGDFVFGYIHGKGKKTYADSSEYEGDWKKNKRAGQGRYTLKKQGKKSITYEGQFQDDFQHGKDVKAIHHHQTGLDLVVQGEYRRGKPIGQHILIFNEIPQRQIDY